MSGNDVGRWLSNGSGANWSRLMMLALQGVIVVGMFWAGATFVHKTDFEAYKTEQEVRRAETFKTLSEISNIMGRIDERLKNEERARQEQKH
jgi:hypothetical protein